MDSIKKTPPQLVPKSLSESQEAEKLWPKQRKFCNWKAKKNSFKKKANEIFQIMNLAFWIKKFRWNDSQEKYLGFSSDYSYSNAIRYVKPRTSDNHSALEID